MSTKDLRDVAGAEDALSEAFAAALEQRERVALLLRHGIEQGLLRDGVLAGLVSAGLVSASVSGSFGLFDRLSTPIEEDLADSSMVRGAYELMLHEIEQPGFGTSAFTSALMKMCLLITMMQLSKIIFFKNLFSVTKSLLKNDGLCT